MEQVIAGTRYSQTTNDWTLLFAARGAQSLENKMQQLVSTPGKLKNLKVRVNSAPGAGNSLSYTVRINGANSALSVTISDTATTGEDTTNEVTVAAGDRIGLALVRTGSPSLDVFWVNLIFEGDNGRESLLLGEGNPNSSAIGYLPITSAESVGGGTESVQQQICPTAGKIKNLYVELVSSPGASPKGYRFTFRVNGVSSALSCTVTGPATTANDTANSIDVSPGDLLSILVEPLNSPDAVADVYYGTTFEATIDNEALLLGHEWTTVNSATRYTRLISSAGADGWDATEGNVDQRFPACGLKKLWVTLSAAPGSGKSYAFTIRKNGADTALVVTISGTATVGAITSVDVSVSDGDFVSLKCVPSGTPTAVDAFWGLVVRPPPQPFQGANIIAGLKGTIRHVSEEGIYRLEIALGGYGRGFRITPWAYYEAPEPETPPDFSDGGGPSPPSGPDICAAAQEAWNTWQQFAINPPWRMTPEEQHAWETQKNILWNIYMSLHAACSLTKGSGGGASGSRHSATIEELTRGRKPLKDWQPGQIDSSLRRVARSPQHQVIVHNIVFTAVDHNSISWAAGQIKLSTGGLMTVDAGTLELTATHYIYYTLGNSTLQSSTTFSDALSYQNMLIAIATAVTSPALAKIQVIFGLPSGGLDLADIFDANTILKADVDNTPEPLTVAEQTLVGRITAGEITALTPAQIMALLSGGAAAEFLFNTQQVGGIVDPTTDQQAATKKYADDTAFLWGLVLG